VRILRCGRGGQRSIAAPTGGLRDKKQLRNGTLVVRILRD
jgi:hypothetical protein